MPAGFTEGSAGAAAAGRAETRKTPATARVAARRDFESSMEVHLVMVGADARCRVFGA
jgi:hypothetical protein